MSQINPFIGSVLQAPSAQRAAAADKDRQLRKASDLQKNAGLSEDRFEHAVESAEALDPAHDEQKQEPKKKRPAKAPKKKSESDEDEPRLDLTA